MLALGTPAASAQYAAAGSENFRDNSPVEIAAGRLQPYFLKNLPLVRDWTTIYPTVPALPNGASFAPSRDIGRQSLLEAQIVAQLHGSNNGAVVLGGGDYAIPVRMYCTDVLRRARAPQTYVLGPLRGTRAFVLTALYANAAAAAPPFETLQTLSWSLQEGLKYGELPHAQRAVFDELLPGWRTQIASSFVDLMSERWNIASRGIGGAPPFDEALPQMGEMGRIISNAESARRMIFGYETDFDALRAALVPGGIDAGIAADATPWSVPAPNVFERLLARGAMGSVAVLEIHVDGTARSVVPLTSNIAYAQQCTDCQPLTMHPVQPAVR